MSIDQTSDVQRGLVVPDPRISIDPTDPAHTWVDADTRAGVPEPVTQPAPMMVLKASGHQAPGDSLLLEAVRAGFSGDRRRAGGYVYRPTSDERWRGWDVPHAVSGWEWVARASLVAPRQPHMLRLADGDVMLAYLQTQSGSQEIVVRRYALATGTWQHMAIIAMPTITVAGEQISSQAWPCLVQLPTGRIHLYAWVEDVTAGYAQLSRWHSDDGGETWARSVRWCLEEEIDLTSEAIGGRIRVAYNEGQLLAIGRIGATLRQWASDDLGAQLVRVRSDSEPVARSPALMPLPGGRWMVLCVDGADNVVPVRLSSAWEQADPIHGTALAPMSGQTDEVDVWPDEDGTWYALLCRGAAHNDQLRMQVLRTSDSGGTWQRLGYPWPRGGAGHRPHGYAVAMTAGLTMVATRFTEEVSGLGADSLLMLYLGGHSTRTMPSSTRSRRDHHQARWELLWLPTDPPNAWGWSLTQSGATAAELGPEGHEIVCGAGGARMYALGGATALPGAEIWVAAQVRVPASVVGAYAHITTWGGDPTEGTGVQLRLTATRIAIHTAGGGVTGVSVEVPLAEAPHQILLAAGRGRVTVWYRRVDEAGHPEQVWTVGPATSLAPGPAPLAGTVRIGVVGEASAVWGHVAATGVLRAGELADYRDLFARSFSPAPVRLPSGVQLEGTGGPVEEGARWRIDPRSERGLEHVDPVRYPSPRRIARTTVPKPSVVYALPGDLDTDTLAVGIYGATTCDVALHGRAPGGDWEPLTTGSSWVEGLKYVRYGDSIRPDPSAPVPATEPLYVERDMLAGAVIDLGGGQLRRIESNTEGWWGPGVSRAPVLYLDPAYMDDTEPPSGTARLGPAERGQVILVSGVRGLEALRIDYGLGYGDHTDVGTVVVGPLLLWGTEYSWGRVLETEPDTALTTLRGGTRHSRVQGPPRRSVDLAWADGVITRELRSGRPPDYRRAWVGGEPTATVADVGAMLEGLLRQIEGPHRPVIYLPGVPSDSRELRLLWPWQHLYGRVTTSVRREPYLGDEWRGEVERISTVRIEEEL